MLIGELVKQTGIARGTIRYYEGLGLLQAKGRPARANNYKWYPPETVARLHLIQQLKNLSFSLIEIAEGLRMLDNAQLSDGQMKRLAIDKLATIDAKIAALQAIRQSLVFSMDQINKGQCTIQQLMIDPVATALAQGKPTPTRQRSPVSRSPDSPAPSTR